VPNAFFTGAGLGMLYRSHRSGASRRRSPPGAVA
jgi:hypothetical protein